MDDRNLLTREGLAQTFGSIAPRTERVGIEIESGLVDSKSGMSVPYFGERGALALLDRTIREMNGTPLFDGAYATGVELPNGARFMLETGGALEYASNPSAGLSETIDSSRSDMLRLAEIANRFGIALLTGGCLPFTSRKRIPWAPKPRVQIMRNYFRELGEPGKHADAVMGLALSTQTSLDYLSSNDLLEKLRLHVLAAPIIAALFVNSPIAEGKVSGALSRRMQYWQKFDPGRCGVLAFALNSDASEFDIVDWAAQFPMIYRDVQGTHVPAPRSSFNDLMQNGFNDGTWPTYADWELHLCQLWPHVRIRRTLELRASDGLPWPHFSASPAVWVGLTYDQKVRESASTLLAELTATQLNQAVEDIAIKGLAASVGPYQVHELARELIYLSKRGLMSRIENGFDPPKILTYLEPIEEVCESGKTFAENSLADWSGTLKCSAEAYVRRYRVPVVGR